jgi:dihydroneopterin aldolase
MQRQKRKLIEVLASDILDEILEAWPIVSFAEVTIAKPAPPAPMIAAAVGVTLQRRRT